VVATAAFVAAVAAGSAALAATLSRPKAVQPHPATPSPATAASPAATSSPQPTPSRGPARLRIPAIGVDAPVEPVGVTADGKMDVPREVDDVGWYSPGVRPGEPGDAVFDGHLDWYTGPAVFAGLHRLRSGDVIEIDLAGGGTVSFHVYQTATYPADQPPPDLFGRDGTPRLTLITCAGRWDGHAYSRRLVVDAR